jgi:hypothetical protein
MASCASSTGIGVLTGGVGVHCDSTGALGTGAALLTALVWELCGGDGAVSTGTGLLSTRVGVRLGEASSLSIGVGVQSARVWVMCGRDGSRACTTGVLSPPRGSTLLFEDCVFTPLDTAITCSNSNG